MARKSWWLGRGRGRARHRRGGADRHRGQGRGCVGARRRRSARGRTSLFRAAGSTSPAEAVAQAKSWYSGSAGSQFADRVASRQPRSRARLSVAVARQRCGVCVAVRGRESARRRGRGGRQGFGGMAKLRGVVEARARSWSRFCCGSAARSTA